jgi:hypothetical protein
MLTHPELYGFYFRKQDLYAPFDYTAVSVDSSISDLADFSIQNKINYKILKLLNPWLRQNYLTNKEKKKYTLKILKAGYTGLDD